MYGSPNITFVVLLFIRKRRIDNKTGIYKPNDIETKYNISVEIIFLSKKDWTNCLDEKSTVLFIIRGNSNFNTNVIKLETKNGMSNLTAFSFITVL